MEDWRRHLAAEDAERAAARARHQSVQSTEAWADISWSDRGRMSRGWELVDRSWKYLRRRPRLLVLPALSTLAMSLAAVAIFVPVLYLTRDASAKVSLFAAGAASALPFTFITTFFNVGFLSMVLADERGEQPSVRDGLRMARGRLGPIFAWSLLSALVGTALDGLARLPGGDWAGRLAGWLGGLAWSLATFFVVPVLVLEGTGARGAVRRSARAFRERWGEAVTGDVTIGVVFSVLTIPGIIPAVLAADRLGHGIDATGVALAALAAVMIVPLLVVSGALTELFLLSLYRLTTTGAAPGPFTESQLRDAMQPRRRRWWSWG